MDRKKLHPTCHKLSLTVTAKFVAFFDMAFGLFGLVWFVIMLARYSLISLDPFENLAANNGTKMGASMDSLGLEATTVSHRPQGFSVNHKVISLSLVAFYTITNLSVFVLLMVGIYKRSAGICLIWFYIRCAIFVFKLIILVMYLIGGRPLFHHIPFIFSMVVHLYGLWVVNCYVDELRGYKQEVAEEQCKEEQEKDSSEGTNAKDIYDVPNGIEAIHQSRLKEWRLKGKLDGVE